jgi:hypothetical protein
MEGKLKPGRQIKNLEDKSKMWKINQNPEVNQKFGR